MYILLGFIKISYIKTTYLHIYVRMILFIQKLFKYKNINRYECLIKYCKRIHKLYKQQ